MVCIRNTGYRIAKANEHGMLANNRKRRADVQVRKGLDILRNVRWDDMDEESRKAHQGQLMVSEGIYGLMQSLAKRQDKLEEVIKDMQNPSDRA
jgi:hypothetical protein